MLDYQRVIPYNESIIINQHGPMGFEHCSGWTQSHTHTPKVSHPKSGKHMFQSTAGCP